MFQEELLDTKAVESLIVCSGSEVPDGLQTPEWLAAELLNAAATHGSHQSGRHVAGIGATCEAMPARPAKRKNANTTRMDFVEMRGLRLHGFPCDVQRELLIVKVPDDSPVRFFLMMATSVIDRLLSSLGKVDGSTRITGAAKAMKEESALPIMPLRGCDLAPARTLALASCRGVSN